MVLCLGGGGLLAIFSVMIGLLSSMVTATTTNRLAGLLAGSSMPTWFHFQLCGELSVCT